jgi:NAD(P)-dependent dehydrogenase (short-subunit alcohol dehydrogenase family)
MSAATLLRSELLQGISLLIAGPPAPLGAAIARDLSELGARVSICLPNGEDESAIDSAVAGALAEMGAIDVLVVDGAALFANGAPTALRACLDAAWNVTRAVVNHAFLSAQPSGRDGEGERDPPTRRIVYLTPAPDAGEHALAARAGLENLARTLSVEWARHHINVIAIGGRGSGVWGSDTTTPADEVAALVAYLASPAGAYFTGCLLDFGGAARPLS